MAALRRTPAKIRLGSAFVAVTAVAITAGTIGFGSAGAAVPVSQATGTFLSGTLLGTNLDNLAQLAGASAVNNGGPTVTDSHPLDATVLSGIELNLGGGAQLPLSDIIQLGAINEYATARPDGTSYGASGTVTDQGAVATYDPNSSQQAASLDLTRLLPPTVTGTISNLTLGIGAIAATADEAAGCAVTPDYELAGVTLGLTSPLVAGVTDQLLGALDNPLLNGLIATLNSTPFIAGVPNLANIVNGAATLLQDDQDNDGIPSLTVNLATGVVSVNVDELLQESAGLDLNNLPANTELLPYITDALTQRLPVLLGQYVTNITGDLNTALQGITVAGVPITGVPGTLALVNQILSTVTSQLNNATTALNTSLVGPLVDALTNNLVSLIVNKQNQTTDGTFTETALAVALPPDGSVAGLNLASATVGPNEADCADATATGISPNQGPETGGTPVTITGTNFVQGATSVTIGGIVVPPCSVPPAQADPNPCVTVSADGTTLTFSTPPHAPGAVNVTVTTPNGTTDPLTFTYLPAAPVITAPTDGSTVSDSTPPISGTASGPDGSTVTVTEGSTTICTATVTGGTWTCTPSTPLADRSHTITATQTVNGAQSPPSDPVTFTVNTAAPAVPAPVITSPANNSTVADTTPPITGTGVDGATVTVTDENGNTVCTATVSGTNWTCTPTTPFPPGSHTITATQTQSGTTSPASDPVTFTVAVAPDAPVITSPTDGSTTTDTTPPITGTGVDGATVTVTDENGNTVCTATVSGTNWTCTPTTPFPPGSHTITATQTQNGTTSPASAPVTFTVVNTSAAPPAPPVITSPTDGSTVTDGTPPITGTGTPGDAVTVTDENGDTVCTATVQADGTWTCTPTTPFTEGDHTITATQTSPDGAVSAPSAPVNFTVDLPPPPPVITSPTDGATTGSTPTVTGTGQPGATVTVTTDGNPGCTATVQPDGTWSCQITSPLGDGPHTISATQTDAGGTSGPDSVGVTVAATTTPADNGGGLGGGTGGDLAETGTRTEFYLLLAAALISLGIVSTLASRRTP